MEQQNLIKVLWVENDPLILDSYPDEAEIYGIDLHPFDCWDEAEIALKKDYNSWDAIILDAKCKHHKDSYDKATSFLVAATNAISRLSEKNNRQIPWFILSGGSEEEISDLIPEDRELWDIDRKEKYYKKATDRVLLWQRLPFLVERNSSIIPLKSSLYRDVFEALSACELHCDVEAKMINLLLPLHFRNELRADYNNRFMDIRLIIEHLFRSMIKHQIMPPSLLNDGKVNLSWSCKYLRGIEDEQYAKKVPNPPIMPRVMSSNLKQMVDVSGSMLHTEGADITKSKDIHQYMEVVHNTPYLLQSYALHLCDVIIWYRDYLIAHPDDEVNALYWEI